MVAIASLLATAIGAGGWVGNRAATGDPPVKADAATAARRASEFKPSEHGFAFVNSFEGSPLPISLGGVEHRAGLPSRFGLCGGMSAAAADFFLAHRPIPRQTKAPKRGTPLYLYLYSRQTESLGEGLSMAGEFAAWMRAPDEGAHGTRARSLRGFDAIAAPLKRGELVAVGLVLVGPGRPGALWENHQVLAYGLDESPEGRAGRWLIRVYDPNYPGRDDAVIAAELTITTTRGKPLYAGLNVPRVTPGLRCERRVPGRATTPVRGIFAMPYARQVPPGDLAPEAGPKAPVR